MNITLATYRSRGRTARGVYLNLCRLEAGLTQRGAAEAIGVTQGAVSKWESGIADPILPRLADIARVYGVELDVLLDGLDAAGRPA